MFIRVYRDSPFVNRADTRTQSYFITQIFSERKDTASAFDAFLQNVQTDVDNDIEIVADKAMIQQLLCILLDNAIKYTSENKKIIISLTKQHSTVKIQIKDNGIGKKRRPES